MTVSERIMSLVKSSGLTITEIASKTHIDKASFTRWKNKNYKPSIDAIVALSQFFCVSSHWLLTGQEEPTTQTVTTVVSDLSDTEEILLEEYRAADKEKRRAILQAALNTTADKTALGRTNDVPE